MKATQVIMAGLLVLFTSPARAETAGDFRDMPEARQREVITTLVATALQNASATRDGAGHPKSPEQLKGERVLINLTRALFHPDPTNATEPIGVAALSQRIAAEKDSSKSLMDVLGECVDERLTTFRGRPAAAWLPQHGDAYQEAYFRMVFAAPRLPSVTAPAFLAMPEGAQDALIEREAVNLIVHQSARNDPKGQPYPEPDYQMRRGMANLLRALFTADEPRAAAAPAGYAGVRETGRQGAANYHSGPFTAIVRGYTNATAENVKEVFAKTELSDRDQQVYFRFAVAWDRYETSRAASVANYAQFLAHMAEWENATNDAQLQLSVEKLVLEDARRQSNPSVDAVDRIKALLKDFSFSAVVKQQLTAALSPVDRAGRPKPLATIGVEKQKAIALQDLLKHWDTEEMARRIFAAFKADPAVDLEAIARTYIRDELAKR